jgi:hypothetical protein
MKYSLPFKGARRGGGSGWGWVSKFPLLATPKAGVVKRKKKRNLSEPQASLFRFPFWHACFWEPSEGGRRLGVAFFAYFFGEAKK